MLLHGRAVRHAARRLPPALKIGGVRLETGGPPLPPLRRGVAGAVVFQLTQATVQALRTRPADLLRDALRPRCPQAPAWRPWRRLRSAQHGPLWLSAWHDRAVWLVVAPEQGVAALLWRGCRPACGRLSA